MKKFVQSSILYQSIEWSGLSDPKYGFKVESAHRSNNEWNFKVSNDEHEVFVYYEGGDRWFLCSGPVVKPYEYEVFSKHRSMVSMVDGVINHFESIIDEFHAPEWNHEFKFGVQFNDSCVD